MVVAPLAVVEVNAVFALPRTITGFDAALFFTAGFAAGLGAGFATVLLVFSGDFFGDLEATLGADFLVAGLTFFTADFLIGFFAVFFAGTG